MSCRKKKAKRYPQVEKKCFDCGVSWKYGRTARRCGSCGSRKLLLAQPI